MDEILLLLVDTEGDGMEVRVWEWVGGAAIRGPEDGVDGVVSAGELVVGGEADVAALADLGDSKGL